MDWHFAATAFATAITIIDPIGMIPITAATTAHFDVPKRNRIVDLAVAVAAIVMLIFGLIGPAVLDYLRVRPAHAPPAKRSGARARPRIQPSFRSQFR